MPLGAASDDFSTTLRFSNPLRKKTPRGVYLVRLVESDNINTSIYGAFSVSWRLADDGDIIIGYVPGLKPGTKYTGRFVVL